MKLAALVAFVVGLVSFNAPPLEEVRFQPEEGSRVTKTFVEQCRFELDSLVGDAEGATVDASAFGIPLGATAGFGYELVCTEEYASVDGGRPTELLRTYDKTEVWTETMGVRESEDEPGELVGKTVRFVWDEEEEVYERSWVGEAATLADLERWSAELDLLALLPAGEVDAGERWTVRGAPLWNVILSGFDFHRVLGQGLEDANVPEEVAAALEELVNESVAEATWVGVRAEDGVELGEITLAFEAERSFDVDPGLIDLHQEDATVTSFEVELELDLDGTLAWNMAAGRFESFELAGDGMLVLEFAATVDEVPLTVRAEVSIEYSQDAQVEPR